MSPFVQRNYMTRPVKFINLFENDYASDSTNITVNKTTNNIFRPQTCVSLNLHKHFREFCNNGNIKRFFAKTKCEMFGVQEDAYRFKKKKLNRLVAF